MLSVTHECELFLYLFDSTLTTQLCFSPLNNKTNVLGMSYPFFSRSSRPGNRTRVSCIAGGCFTNWAIREALLHGSRALFKTDSLGGGKCRDNNEVRTDRKTNNFNQLMGIPVSLWWLWSAIFLQGKTLSPQLVSVNQPRCLQFYMAQEQRNYGTKQFFSDTFKLLEQTFQTYEITVWPYCFIWKG